MKDVNAIFSGQTTMKNKTQPDDIWVKLIKHKYLKNNMNFLRCNNPKVFDC